MRRKQTSRWILTVSLMIVVAMLSTIVVAFGESAEIEEVLPPAEEVVPPTEDVVEITLDSPVATIENKPTTGKPYLQWEPVEHAEKYEIYRSLSKNGTYERIYTTKKTNYTNTSAEAGTKYYYRIKAVSDSDNVLSSDNSNMVYSLCDLAKPALTVGNRASDGKIRLQWKKVDGATSYAVYRATKKNGTFKRWTTTTKTSVIDSDIKVGKTGYYKVKAIYEQNKAANSVYSKVKSRVRDLPQPKIQVTRRIADAKPKLSWNKIDGASKYVVYRSTKKTGTYRKLYTTTKTSFANTGAKAGVKYYYKLVAISKKTSMANSAYSEIKSCTCGQPYIVSSTDPKYTYNDFKTDMDKLMKKYPDILKKTYLGKTADNRGLYALTLGNPKAKKQIFVTAGFHAREYINCQVTMRLIESYCRNYETGSYKGVKYSDLFQQVSVYIMPMVNPDGIAISTYGPSAIRSEKLQKKIRKMDRNGTYANWKANARGVDLNNNYILYKGTPVADDFASEGYPGPKRFSEKETKAVLKGMDACSNIKAVINYHSMGRVIYWGYHNKNYKAECWAFAKLFRDMTGYYMIDESYSENARGDFEHYIMHEYKIPYVCIENGKGAIPVPIEEFNSIYTKNKLGFAKAAYHYYQ